MKLPALSLSPQSCEQTTLCLRLPGGIDYERKADDVILIVRRSGSGVLNHIDRGFGIFDQRNGNGSESGNGNESVNGAGVWEIENADVSESQESETVSAIDGRSRGGGPL